VLNMPADHAFAWQGLRFILFMHRRHRLLAITADKAQGRDRVTTTNAVAPSPIMLPVVKEPVVPLFVTTTSTA
jgi:hypothetical protein